MKKYLLRWVVLGTAIIGLLAALYFFNYRQSSQICQQINIDFVNTKNPLITKDALLRYIQKDSIRIIGTKTSEMALTAIEESLENNAFVSDANCYVAMNGDLEIEVYQKTPILRVEPTGSKGYYLDENGDFFPLSKEHTPRVKIATGHINHDLDNKLYTFTSYVNQSTFWNGFIEHIFVRPNNDIVFTTQIGGHEVVIGDNSRLEQKLDKLERFYKRASVHIGWEEYREINLKFKDQVICSK
jgi:cell division protein FtsQ